MEGGEVGGGWGAKGGLSTHLNSKSSAVPSVCDINCNNPKGREEQFGTPFSPINVPQDHEMHPRGLTALVKSRL